MKIEIPIRWVENVTDPEALEEAKIRRIISGDEDEDSSIKENTKFTYDLLICDTDDILMFHRFDDENTIIKMSSDDSFCVGIDYDNFKQLYTQLTGQVIHILELKTTPDIELL